MQNSTLNFLKLLLCSLSLLFLSAPTAAGAIPDKSILPVENLLPLKQYDKTIELLVLDENGEPLPGVNVVVKGSLIGGITDLNGTLRLTVPDDAVLEVSFIGYKTETIVVGDETEFTIEMEIDEEQLEEVVVIGSRNQQRTVLESPVAVDVIPMDELIQEAPQVELTQILNYVAPSFSSNRQAIADGSDHVDPASLRGLGVDHVLVLINGKRRHTSSLINVNGSVGRGSVGTDLNTIPAAAIERIEVLRDGASAQYGSDAIAGVINIVLKDDVDEVYFSGTAGQHYEGDGEVAQFNVNYGLRVGERGFINFTGQYQTRGRTNRAGEWTGDVFRTSWDGVSESIFAENFEAGDFSPFQVGVRLTAAQAAAINAANAFTNNLTDAEQEALIEQNGGREAFSMVVGQSAARNAALMMNSAFEISENNEFYMFGGINSRRGMATGFFRLPNQDRTLTTIYPNGFLPEINSIIFDGALTAGIRGEIGEWRVDFSNTYGMNSFNFFISNTLNASRGNSTATSFNSGGFSFSQNTTNLDFSRYWDDALAGVNVAYGAEHRVETYEIIAGEEASYTNYGNVNLVDTLEDGSIFTNPFSQENIFYGRPGGAQVFPGFQPANELRQSRSNIALYADVELNFTENFFTDLAVRFEDYSDFGSTFNWKVASRLALTDDLALRGAVSTGFRAPSLQQRYFNSTSTLFQLNAEGVSVPNEVGTFRNDSRIAELFGIPSLTNETSLNFSAGLAWAILDELDLTIDAYYITVDDRVVLTSSFSGNNSEEIARILALANAGSATFFVNGIDTETRGIDVILAHSATLGAGSLRSQLAANFTRTEVVNVNIPESLREAPERFFNREEENRFEDALPQSKINLLITYNIGRFTAILNNVRFGEVWVRTVSGNENIDQRFSPKIVTGLSLGYNITENLNLTVGGNNIFDVYPDENREEFRSGERFVYSRAASQFGFNGGFYFARLNFTF
ncbi:TonB-dependent receptor [Nafulsella turpanensis]|uniref:TonB-dependent receptor n=1 Tax=Nafulsella turpanensis TaxID=1265690 RepID=UPI0009D9A9AA|nr:TonB-dependent receptor [Nafulsella turpanensis]